MIKIRQMILWTQFEGENSLPLGRLLQLVFHQRGKKWIAKKSCLEMRVKSKSEEVKKKIQANSESECRKMI
jgi:hypothetical protein